MRRSTYHGSSQGDIRPPTLTRQAAMETGSNRIPTTPGLAPDEPSEGFMRTLSTSSITPGPLAVSLSREPALPLAYPLAVTTHSAFALASPMRGGLSHGCVIVSKVKGVAHIRWTMSGVPSSGTVGPLLWHHLGLLLGLLSALRRDRRLGLAAPLLLATAPRSSRRDRGGGGATGTPAWR